MVVAGTILATVAALLASTISAQAATNSTDPAGAWKLYVFDDVAQPDTSNRNGTGTFANGWALQVKGVCTRANASRHCL